ncbi:YHS domain-containing protein [Dactylosporangium sp. NPDC051485]|uniref:YHS domain-containing protein n=1 Tax=Dactylosporangium sp. NPDC051485 TaxID=3154846 RepID=UPI0034432D85
MSNDLPVASTSSCCGGGKAASAPAATPSASSQDSATCPVMAGNLVVKSVAEAAGLFRDYEGNRYWFCCAGCGPLFDADPKRYAISA